jgi:hypothetical protein
MVPLLAYCKLVAQSLKKKTFWHSAPIFFIYDKKRLVHLATEVPRRSSGWANHQSPCASLTETWLPNMLSFSYLHL